MTLIEFLSPLSKGKHQDRILAIIYYKERYEHITSLTTENIKNSLEKARVTGWKKVNVADVLNKAGALVDTAGVQNNKRLWTLTDSGRELVRQQLGLPSHDVEIEHDVGSLEKVIKNINDDDIRDYIEEAISCLKIGAIRASIVFIWSGAIRTLQKKMLNENKSTLNSAVQRHDQRARNISRIDHFAYIKDITTLLAANELGIIDRNEKGILEESLNLRNKCGHPGNYKPGIKKASSFIEDIVSIIFK
jgi:hypothetical protein